MCVAGHDSGPVFEQQPNGLIYPEGLSEGKVTLSCQARASPAASYRCVMDTHTHTHVYLMWPVLLILIVMAVFWYLSPRWLVNGTDVPLGLDLRYTLVAGNLVISSPESARDTGSYQCLAINRCGIIISRAANLKFGCEEDEGFEQLSVLDSVKQ